MKYFRYTLDDLKESSDRKLFTYISFFAGAVVHHAATNLLEEIAVL